MAVPLFRLASISYKAFRGSKIGFWDKGVIESKVHINDLDINVHMNNARYATMFDLGRIDFLVRTGLIKNMWHQKWRPVVGATMISFVKSLRLYEKFKVSTQVIYTDEKWFYLEHLLISKDKIMARAYAKCLFLQKGKKISTLDIFKRLNCENPNMLPPPALVSWIKADADFKLHADPHSEMN